jgi:hypothetical protein
VGEGETKAWFGGPPMVIVVHADTRPGGLVEPNRVVRRAVWQGAPLCTRHLLARRLEALPQVGRPSHDTPAAA